MSDHDRGAYAPQSDAPLTFDPRDQRGGGGRGPAPLTLLLSVLVLVGLGGGVFYFYRHGARHPGQAPQVVGAPVGPTKSAPVAGQGGDNDQAAGLQVYKAEVTPPGEGRGAPTLEAPPEQPAPLPPARPVQPPPAVIAQQPLRPVASAAPAHVTAPVHAATPPPAPASADLRPSKPAPDVVAASGDTSSIAGSAFAPHGPPPPRAVSAARPLSSAKPTSAAKPVVLATQTEPTPPALAKAKPKAKPVEPTPGDELAATSAKAVAPKAVAAAPKAAGGPVTVQIGAFSSSELAQKGFTDDAHALPGQLSGRSHRVEAGSKDGKPIYRTFVGGFATRADAVAFCEALRARNKPCFVK